MMGRGKRMDISLAKRIQEAFPKLSKKHRMLAEHLSKNYDRAVFQTARELAGEIGVSEATVIRFAAALGYDGYPNMQSSLVDLVRNRISTVDRLQYSLRSSQEDIMRAVMNRDILNIQRTMDEISSEDFNAVVKKILAARQIYILALRSTVSVGFFLNFYLHILLKNSRLLDGSGTFFEDLIGIGPNDLVIGLSFARYTRQTVEGLKLAKEKGASTVCITDTDTSPLVPFSDIVFTTRSDSASFIDSFTAPLSLVNALIIAIGKKQPREMTKALSQLEPVWEKYQVYYKE
jgi:DNA-binding MurR/RpiR family transcriptional regulator